MLYETRFLMALALTITIETIALFIAVRLLLKTDKEQLPNSKLLFVGIFTSAATLPYLWFILPAFLKDPIDYIIFGEIIVVVTETAIIYCILKTKIKQAAIISLICNTTSALAGYLIMP